MGHFIKLDGSWIEVLAYYIKENGSWVALTEEGLLTQIEDKVVYFKGPAGEYMVTHSLAISGPSSISGVSCAYSAIYDLFSDVTSAATWTIVSGSQYAEISQTNI